MAKSKKGDEVGGRVDAGRRAARPYRKTKRAEQQESTRRRIVEAALALYASVGPAATTVTEIASRAGVSRMTVYNHFPGDAELSEACFDQWIASAPLPELEAWIAIEDVDARLGVALARLYSWYSSAAPMMGNLLRDAPRVPALAGVLEQRWQPRVDEMIDSLSIERDLRGRAETRLRGAIRVAVDLGTWEALTTVGLTDREAAELAAGFVIVTDASFATV